MLWGCTDEHNRSIFHVYSWTWNAPYILWLFGIIGVRFSIYDIFKKSLHSTFFLVLISILCLVSSCSVSCNAVCMWLRYQTFLLARFGQHITNSGWCWRCFFERPNSSSKLCRSTGWVNLSECLSGLVILHPTYSSNFHTLRIHICPLTAPWQFLLPLDSHLTNWRRSRTQLWSVHVLSIKKQTGTSCTPFLVHAFHTFQ